MERAEAMASITRTVEVANAPCSYGAFEETIGIDPLTPDGGEVLQEVSAAGYAGIDLGPVGYLGNPAGLGARLDAHHLELAGGYLPMTFDDPPALGVEVGQLRDLLDVFDATERIQIAPKPTLAAASLPKARLTRAEERPQRTHTEWQRFADGVSLAVELCRTRGYEPAFHHHAGTWIETPAEIERLLSLTDVSLCLDTGHLAVAAGDPQQAVRDWGERINHVHVKDAHLGAVDALVTAGDPVDELWRGDVFTPLGDGDLDCAAFFEAMRSIEYVGWIVVEQDVLPASGEGVLRIRNDQVRSRAFLRRHGF
jgi:inosose dehydratase